MPEFRTITDGLHFPEGPIAMPDGSIVLVEIEAGNLTRVQPDGSKEVIAHLGDGPNGAAIGPDGACLAPSRRIASCADLLPTSMGWSVDSRKSNPTRPPTPAVPF